MTATNSTPTLAELLRGAIDARSADLHVAAVGEVVSYDLATQRADVRPVSRRVVPSGVDDADDVEEEMPIVPAVPVLHPRAGNHFIHLPVSAGDAVLLVFCDRDFEPWRQTGSVATPGDQRLHHLSHAVAIPGLFSVAQELDEAADGLAAGTITMGKRGGSAMRARLTDGHLRAGIGSATLLSVGDGIVQAGGSSADAAARASAVNAIVNAIVNTVIVPNDGGAAIKAAVTAAWSGVGSSSVSAVLKISG